VGFEFLDRVRRTSAAAGIVIALIVWLLIGPGAAGAFALGCVWSLVNLHLLRIIARLVATDPENHKLRIAAVLFFKVPVLYGAAYLAVHVAGLPVVGFLAGFAWPLAVIALKAAGRLVLGLDENERADAGGVDRGS